MDLQPERKALWIVDTTLRDGEQAAGVAFSGRDRLRIARRIAGTGVQELEIGTPAMGPEVCEDMRYVAALRLPCRLTAWCRAKREDVEAAQTCDVSAVHVSFPVSERHMAVLKLTPDEVVERIVELVAFARQRFDFVSVGAQDASRAAVDFLVRCAQAARDAGAARFRVADTVGVLTPRKTWNLFRTIRAGAPGIDLGLHAHDDLGMATANSIMAWEAGAASVDVTVNGLGERAGNAALEEVLATLRLEWPDNAPFPFRLNRLRNLSRLVEQASGRSLPAGKAVVGNAAFWHESGIHVHGIMKAPETYEPFSPESVGTHGRTIVLGSHSGAAAVQHVLNTLGFRLTREEATAFLPVIRREHRQMHAALSDTDVAVLWKRWRAAHAKP